MKNMTTRIAGLALVVALYGGASGDHDSHTQQNAQPVPSIDSFSPEQKAAWDGLDEAFNDLGALRRLQERLQSSGFSPAQEKAWTEVIGAFPDYQSRLQLGQQVGEKVRLAELDAAKEVYADTSLPAFGPEEGKLVVEFSDYQCGFCKRMFPLFLNENVRVRVIEYPVLGENSRLAARYALAARKQNLYADFHVAMMSRQGRLSPEALDETAGLVGLDLEKLRADLQSPEVNEELEKNFRFARQLNVRGTPFMIIGDNVLRGATSAENLRQLLEGLPPAN